MKSLKNQAVLSLLIFSLFLCIVTVSAIPSLSAPTTDSTLTGATETLTVIDGVDLLNCTWYASSPSTANSSVVSIATQVNASSSVTTLTTTFDSTILEDSSDYSIYAECFNETGGENTSISTGVIIDNTNPTAPVLTPADQTVRSTIGTQEFIGTVVDATTTGCTYTIYRGGSPADGDAGTASYSGTSCTISKDFLSTVDNGVWYVTMTASDGKDTVSTSNKLNANLPGLGGGGFISVTTNDDSILPDGNSSFFMLAFFIVLFIIGILFASNKKK